MKSIRQTDVLCYLAICFGGVDQVYKRKSEVAKILAACVKSGLARSLAGGNNNNETVEKLAKKTGGSLTSFVSRYTKQSMIALCIQGKICRDLFHQENCPQQLRELGAQFDAKVQEHMKSPTEAILIESDDMQMPQLSADESEARASPRKVAPSLKKHKTDESDADDIEHSFCFAYRPFLGDRYNFCVECGTSAIARFCPYCGARTTIK